MENPHALKWQTKKNVESIMRLRLFLLDAMKDGRPRPRRVLIDTALELEIAHQKATRKSRHTRTRDDVQLTAADYLSKLREEGFVEMMEARRLVITAAGLDYLKTHNQALPISTK